jgi:hypothetical protein
MITSSILPDFYQVYSNLFILHFWVLKEQSKFKQKAIIRTNQKVQFKKDQNSWKTLSKN